MTKLWKKGKLKAYSAIYSIPFKVFEEVTLTKEMMETVK